MPVPRPSEYVRSLAAAVDAKGNYFPGHSDGVAYVLRLMTSEAGLSREFVGRMYVAALLHDTGKLMVPDAILNAPRSLTPNEYTTIKTHPVYSGRIAAAIDGCEDIVPWVRHHHEHFDGSGYPDGLAGRQIPYASRMILVADAFHVMTSARPYAKTKTRSDALEILADRAGTQFCPSAVKLLHDREGVVLKGDAAIIGLMETDSMRTRAKHSR